MTAKILTVDDSASIRLTTRVTLTGAGYQVTEAVDGMDGSTSSSPISTCRTWTA
jgi:two-component system chemotaxis response regulator CheY